MRRLTAAVLGAMLAAGSAVGFVAPVRAEGTEGLGPPAIAIATGSGFAVGGTGMQSQPASFDVTVPSGATVQQVLLYWQQHHCNSVAGDDTIVVNGTEVQGTLIGGPTTFFVDWTGCSSDGYVDVTSFRRDITALGLVGPGTSTLTTSGLVTPIAAYGNDGAGVLVIYDDGTVADLAVRDGLDLAFHAFGSPLDTTVAQTFTFAAEGTSRTARLPIFAGSVESGRPNAIDITVGGATTKLVNPLGDSAGPSWDVLHLPVTIPAGASSLTVQLLSESDGSGNNPASLSWVVGALAVPRTPPPPPPPPPPPGVGAGTPGYWKNHPEAWPVSSLTVGGVSYTKSQLIPILGQPTTKDATIILSRQLIAAKLNVIIGNPDSCVASTITDADTLLASHPPGSGLRPSSSAGQQAVALAAHLDAYNNGELCAPPRDD